MAIDLLNFYEGQDTDIVFQVDSDTTGSTIDFRMTSYDAGTVSSIGTVAGTTADTDISITLLLSSLAVGEYRFEVFTDFLTTRKMIYPLAGDIEIAKIVTVRALP